MFTVNYFGKLTKLLFMLQFSEDEFHLRTIDGHVHQVELVETDPSCISTYGVKRDSILNSSRYFHVVGGLPSDIMHDLLEGCIPYQVKLLVKHIIDQQYISLQAINERIVQFPYGATDAKNKPVPLLESQIKGEDSSKLRQNGKLILSGISYLQNVVNYYLS